LPFESLEPELLSPLVPPSEELELELELLSALESLLAFFEEPSPPLVDLL